LYGRRGFPFYSFCVLAGLSSSSSSCNKGSGGSSKSKSRGCVYAYDAIGSFEQVAVASAGTGRSLLQPILDGAFASHRITTRTNHHRVAAAAATPNQATVSPRSNAVGVIHHYSSDRDSDDAVSDHVVLKDQDMDLLQPQQQREQQVQEADEQQEDGLLVVDCSADEACRILLQAYRAVSEREIGVGDYVVLYCLQRQGPQPPGHGHGSGDNDDDDDDNDDGEVLQCQIQVVPLKMH
jgi:hypothetical protein